MKGFLWFTAALLGAATGAGAVPGAELPAGPVELEVVFPAAGPQGRAEPLLSVGGPGAGDVIFAQYLSHQQVSLGWENSRAGAVLTAPLPLGDGRAHKIAVLLGCMIPEAGAAATNPGMSRPLPRESAIVLADGVPVILMRHDYPAGPPPREVMGVNEVGGAMAGPRFTGQIVGVRRLPPADLMRFTAGTLGPIRLILRFPSNRMQTADPLLVTGRNGAGDLVYVRYAGPDKIRLGLDHWGVGGPESELIGTNFSHPHEIILSTVALLPPVPAGAGDFYTGLRARNVVMLDGRIVLDAAGPNYPTTPQQVAIGRNDIGGSTCGLEFNGQIESSGPASTAEIFRLLQPAPLRPDQIVTSNGAGYPGPVRLRLKFPPPQPGVREPLVSTGTNGSGDLLSVSDESDGRLRMVLDHWGYANLSSAPFALDRTREHEVVISLGGFLPPPRPEDSQLERLRSRCLVLLDGRVVMDAPSEFHPAGPASIRFGENAINASDAVPAFTGRIESVQSVPVAEVLALAP